MNAALTRLRKLVLRKRIVVRVRGRVSRATVYTVRRYPCKYFPLLLQASEHAVAANTI